VVERPCWGPVGSGCVLFFFLGLGCAFFWVLLLGADVGVSYGLLLLLVTGCDVR